MLYVYQPYPRRLYPGGVVDHTDLHARASVVVNSAEEEEEARAKGFRKAYETDPIGGNGGSEAQAVHSSVLPDDQGGAAPVSAGPDAEGEADAALEEASEALDAADAALDDVAALRAEAAGLGLKPHHKAGAAKLREMIAAARG